MKTRHATTIQELSAIAMECELESDEISHAIMRAWHRGSDTQSRHCLRLMRRLNQIRIRASRAQDKSTTIL
jgi:hypothetical protein